MRLLIHIDDGDGALPVGTQAVPILTEDMETTRNQAQKAVDHLLQNLTMSEQFRSAKREDASSAIPQSQPPSVLERVHAAVKAVGTKGGQKAPARKTPSRPKRKR